MNRAAVTLVVLASLTGPAMAGTATYLCTAERGANWDSPMLADDSISTAMLKATRQFVFDTSTATFRLVNQQDRTLLPPLQFRVLNEGNDVDSDFVAENPLEHSLLRIRTWQKALRFFLFESLMIYSGSCAPLEVGQ